MNYSSYEYYAMLWLLIQIDGQTAMQIFICATLIPLSSDTDWLFCITWHLMQNDAHHTSDPSILYVIHC